MSSENITITLTTKHRKEVVIAPVFQKILSAKIETCELDTDKLGTFSGEIGREHSALESARIKCLWGMAQSNSIYGLASEGSFGPHPGNPFIPCNQEIIYFIDKHLDMHLSEAVFSEKTNYKMKALDTIEELMKFAREALFPDHALILRPNIWEDKKIIFKGLQNIESLTGAFEQAKRISRDNKVWCETDMRAHMNPTRMQVIGRVAEKLAKRLKTLCPKCSNSGWGLVGIVKGLICSACGEPTGLVKEETLGCQICGFRLVQPREDRLTLADPRNCDFCNP